MAPTAVVATPVTTLDVIAAAAAPLAPLLLCGSLQQRAKNRSCWQPTRLAADAYGLPCPLYFIQQQLLLYS